MDRKARLILFVLLVVPGWSQALSFDFTGVLPVVEDYEPRALDQLIGTAELVVEGEVVRVMQGTLEIRVRDIIVGNGSGKIIVKQFHPSKFEGRPRWIPYEVGQSYIFFLKVSADQAAVWEVIGRAGEGEVPVFKGFAYFEMANIESLPDDDYELWGNRMRSQRYPEAAVVAAFKGYRQCFTWTSATKTSKANALVPTVRCSATDLDLYKGRSSFHHFLTQLSLKRIEK